ncbi:histone-fold-containing protein [Tilletiaria anomala UBC 951]|uniref:Histone-fold-containing protein n=1 Tax=Tilletiaria anomala (strain ATCC 24038 / CBS 436.72 / UBC 951) TaxID=1037660 RepID=A0A066W9M6_TILAU|nr:histone-fold-containing protein [Tilletiaria anomala UBC 951]KDN50421.1 histone-fold-containing protein [Tilletiaria anomala UBC 951]
MSDEENFAEGSGSGFTEDDLSLPKATVQKIIQGVIPSDISCAKDTREVLIECCIEFLHLISSESNEVCERESKKTIAPEHVIQALRDLGFENFVEGVEDILKDHKQMAKEREQKISKKVQDMGMTPEELQRHQEMLFAASKARYEATND